MAFATCRLPIILLANIGEHDELLIVQYVVLCDLTS